MSRRSRRRARAGAAMARSAPSSGQSSTVSCAAPTHRHPFSRGPDMLETSLTAPRAIAHPAPLTAAPLAAVERDGFEQAILPRDGASLVLFGAAWRRAGRDAMAHLQRVADRRGLLAVFVDVEKSPELARRYRVTAIPSLLLFQRGQEAARRLGELGEDGLEDWLAAALA